ncbi:MAG: AtpZ/AtpI family protein [Lachnospiraceae bacterium]
MKPDMPVGDEKVAGRKKYDKSVYRSMVLITQFGINMLVPVFLCFFIGYWLDGRLGTSYWTIVLFFVGALAGFRNIYIMAKQIYESKDKHDR